MRKTISQQSPNQPPLTMRRRWFITREHFHDWMWDGGPRPRLGRRLARALPTYFSDPYMPGVKELRRLKFEPPPPPTGPKTPRA